MQKHSQQSAVSRVGMMEGAFFVSRTELLNWVNDFFTLGLSKVEQCANGAVYCQIMDSLFPGTVRMERVKWAAHDEASMVSNYKILQASFNANNIERHIEVAKLIRGKYQDSLEMLQFMKHMWDRLYSNEHYDAVERRLRSQHRDFPSWCDQENAPPPRKGEQNSRGQNGQAVPAAQRQRSPGAAPASRAQAARPTPATTGRVRQLEADLDEARKAAQGLEHERDFYFQRLREVEILTQQLDPKEGGKLDPSMTVPDLIEKLQAILYADE